MLFIASSRKTMCQNQYRKKNSTRETLRVIVLEERIIPSVTLKNREEIWIKFPVNYHFNLYPTNFEIWQWQYGLIRDITLQKPVKIPGHTWNLEISCSRKKQVFTFCLIFIWQNKMFGKALFSVTVKARAFVQKL